MLKETNGDAAAADAAVAAHNLRPRHPLELKWLFVDLLLVITILGHAALLLGEPLVGFEDDESDCFHQFSLMLATLRDCGLLLLATRMRSLRVCSARR